MSAPLDAAVPPATPLATPHAHATDPASAAFSAPGAAPALPPPPAPVDVPPRIATPATAAASAAARVVDRGSGRRHAVALTFDAGADAGFAAAILDTLREHGVHVSFGLTGVWAEQQPELVRRIAREGHVLINHSYDHGSFTGASTGRGPLSRTARWEQLDRTAQVLRELTGDDATPYFRPPYGDWDASVNSDVGARGYPHNVMWTVDSLGWRGLAATDIAQRCLAAASPSAIYIFHVGSQSQDAAALPRIIDGLRARLRARDRRRATRRVTGARGRRQPPRILRTRPVHSGGLA
ncbi:MAG: polysaccharide deacetylase family protein [Dehalococcoidia bacterium]|nr:polysaccharide deacetylase family protein [Dehalococcoidia bacterium]